MSTERYGRGSRAICWVLMLWIITFNAPGQTGPYDRTFPQSKAVVEKALKQLQSQAAGRLPTLDGFAASVDRPLDRFQRGYYQCTADVTSLPTGGTRVRVSAKITAWYSDPAGSRSGYQVLPSNGRIESDFLDELQDALLKSSANKTSDPKTPVNKSDSKSATTAPAMSAPLPQDSVPGEPIGKSVSAGSSPFKAGTGVDGFASLETRKSITDKHADELTKEAKNLEEIARNQSHPNNLVAVKRSGTPVLVSPVEGAKLLFLASSEDEFEVLDTNTNWVHIRISGLSRGWIRSSEVEMPEETTPRAEQQATPVAGATTPDANDKIAFRVENEQIASFPGNWEPLRGRTVKIISVQEVKGRPNETGSQAKLDYAKSLFSREYVELTREPTLAAGVVVVFDSEDGGMMATTLPVLQQWKAGTLSDEGMWRRCYFDPPEMFRAASTP